MSVTIKVEVSKRLKDWRMLMATTNNVELYRILHNDTINQIANDLPQTNIDLLAIKGLGPAKVKKYGSDILKIVNDCQQISDQVDIVDDQESISVSELLTRINYSLAKHTIRVRGEVYGSVNERGKAIYFKIKDLEQNALLECFAWSDTFSGKGIYPTEGAEVILEGQVQIFPPTGRFSLQVKLLELRGEGLLKQAYEKLKSELEKSGAFNPELKRPLPALPRNIALITAEGSDAQTDFLTHVKSHGFNIHQYDVRVEGIKSESEIVDAFKKINASGFAYDCVVITRGGGSLEALQGYNSKAVVQAVQSCRFPVISAVGHERDVTLCDLVSDIRVSTPTDAGKLLDRIILDYIQRNYNKVVTFKQFLADVVQSIDSNNINVEQKLIHLMRQIISTYQMQFVTALKSLSYQFSAIENTIDRPITIYNQITYQVQTRLDKLDNNIQLEISRANNNADQLINIIYNTIQQYQEFVKFDVNRYLTGLSSIITDTKRTGKNLFTQFNYLLDNCDKKLDKVAQVIKLQNPETILNKGYAIVKVNEKVLRSVDDVGSREKLNITVIDGTVKAITQ